VGKDLLDQKGPLAQKVRKELLGLWYHLQVLSDPARVLLMDQPT